MGEAGLLALLSVILGIGIWSGSVERTAWSDFGILGVMMLEGSLLWLLIVWYVGVDDPR